MISGPLFIRCALIYVVCITLSVCATTAAVTFEWVTVGDPGNPDNFLEGGRGAVDYEYRIAKYEVTNQQYADFLNAVAASDPNDLYHPNMGTDVRGGIVRSGSSGGYTYSTRVHMANKPVNYVSFLDAMRFVNWLQNGQGNGGTETGVYDIDNGLTEARDPNAQYFLPSEDEWFKAAYYQPASQGGDSDGYWLYPTGSNATPTVALANSAGDISNPGPNVVNYDSGAAWNDSDAYGNVTTVGSAGPGSSSFYGTLDQGGNVIEWNEAVLDTPSGFFRGLSGGAFNSTEVLLGTTVQAGALPSDSGFGTGIRVASPIPEPMMLALFSTGMPLLIGRHIRRITPSVGHRLFSDVAV